MEGKQINFDKDSFKLSSDGNYLKLKEYLWKGVSTFEKNSSGSYISDEDKEIIAELVEKVEKIRNFHSHYWHDNSVLQFSESLKNFVENQYEIALKETSRLEQVSGELFYKEVEPKFKPFQKHDQQFFITQEGRLFFLSIFLNKGDMDALLQISKGSKANFLPEHRFKRKAYTYLCHREGATWFNPIVSTDEQELFSENEQKQFYYNSQGLKIFGYLKDQPLYYMNPDFMPLWFNKDGKATEVSDIEDLLLFIQQNILFSFLEFSVKDYHQQKMDAEEEQDFKKREAKLKTIEDKERVGAIEMRMKENKEYDFEISYPTLYQVCLECYFDKERIDAFKTVLESLMKRRKYLFDILTSDKAGEDGYFDRISKEYFYPRISPKDKAEKEAKQQGKTEEEIERIIKSLPDEFYSIEELSSFPIGGNAKTIDKLKSWGEQQTKGKKGKRAARYRAVNLIRPHSIPFFKDKGEYRDTAPQPILVHLSEFFKGTNAKPRNQNKFLEWSAQYLMDFGLCSHWEFAYEEYKTEQKFNNDKNAEKTRIKKKILYSNEIKEDKRIKIMKEQLFFRTPKKDSLTTSSNPEDYYYFMLGEKAMVYLLNWILINNGKSTEKNLNDFIKTLANDLNIVGEKGINAVSDLKLYEYHEKDKNNHFAPTLPKFKLDKSESKTLAIGGIIRKTQYKINELENLKKNADSFSRNEINSHLLRIYQLFDFSETKGSKFLRKNEVQLMSVVHYMRNQKGSDLKFYLEKKFIVNGAKLAERIPKEIFEFILGTKSLKELFLAVLNNRIENLEMGLDDLKEKEDSLSNVAKSCYYIQKLAKNTNEEESKKGKKLSYPFLPLYIHPNLVLKYFDESGFKGGDYHPEIENPDKKHTNIYHNIRQNSALKDLLNATYYEASWEEKLLSVLKNIPDDKKMLLKKLRNWYNRYRLHTHTEDILLYVVGRAYLEKYNPDLVEELRNFRISSQTDLDRLFRKEIVKKLMDKEGNGIYISYRLHQTDDHFYRIAKQDFLNLSKHYLQRKKWEIAFYKDRDSSIAGQLEAMPSGEENSPIPMGFLLQERKIITNASVEIAKYLIDLEKGWIEDLAGIGNDYTKQKKLVEFYTKNSDKKEKHYLSFSTLVNKFIPDKEIKITDLRNAVFHNLIPEKPFVPFLGMEAIKENKLFEILKINERIGKDKSKPSGYEQEK